MTQLSEDEVDDFDPQADLDRLIASKGCERCGCVSDELGSGFKQIWRCHEVKHAGYTSKHWRYWRLCKCCLVGFTADIFKFLPFIQSMYSKSLEDLIQLQPMAGPSANVFYMDFVHQPVENPCGEVPVIPMDLVYGVRNPRGGIALAPVQSAYELEAERLAHVREIAIANSVSFVTAMQKRAIDLVLPDTLPVFIYDV